MRISDWSSTCALPICMPFFFVGLTALALSSVPAQHQTSAAGLMSFLRTLCGAIGTAIATTAWDDASRTSRSELVSSLNNVEATMTSLQNAGFTLEQARVAIERLVEVQASTIGRSEEHTSELQSLMRISYAVFC